MVRSAGAHIGVLVLTQAVRIGPGLVFKVSCYLKWDSVTAHRESHFGFSTNSKSEFPDSQKTLPVVSLTLKDRQAARGQDLSLELAGYCPLSTFLSWFHLVS